ncbi:MAG: hypothetical protein ACYCWW_15340 [Deltaproteobacteria bacterium]
MSPQPSMKPARVSMRVDAMVRGVRSKLRPGKRFHVGGVAHDRASLLLKLGPVQEANRAVAEARRALTARILERERLHEEIRPFLSNLAMALGNELGPANPILSAFGVPVARPRRQPTSAQKAISAAEGVRTRRIRGSYTSKKQLAEITAEGRPGLALVDPQGNVTPLLPPAPPGKPRPKRR